MTVLGFKKNQWPYEIYMPFKSDLVQANKSVTAKESRQVVYIYTPSIPRLPKAQVAKVFSFSAISTAAR